MHLLNVAIHKNQNLWQTVCKTLRLLSPAYKVSKTNFWSVCTNNIFSGPRVSEVYNIYYV